MYVIKCTNPLSSLSKDDLILSWRRSLSYENQFIDLLWKSIDWLLYDRDLHYESASKSFRFWRVFFFQQRMPGLYVQMNSLKREMPEGYKNTINMRWWLFQRILFIMQILSVIFRKKLTGSPLCFWVYLVVV